MLIWTLKFKHVSIRHANSAKIKEESVAELMKFTNRVLFWDVSFFRGFHVWEMEVVVELHGYNIWLLSKGAWGG